MTIEFKGKKEKLYKYLILLIKKLKANDMRAKNVTKTLNFTNHLG